MWKTHGFFEEHDLQMVAFPHLLVYGRVCSVGLPLLTQQVFAVAIVKAILEELPPQNTAYETSLLGPV